MFGHVSAQTAIWSAADQSNALLCVKIVEEYQLKININSQEIAQLNMPTHNSDMI